MFDDIIAGLMKAGGEAMPEPQPIDPNLLADRLLRKGIEAPAPARQKPAHAPVDFGADDETVDPKAKQPSLDFGNDDEVVGAKPPTSVPLPKPRPADAPQPPPDLGTPAPVENGMPAVQPLDDQPFRTGGTVLDSRAGATSGMLSGDKAYQQQQDTLAAAASEREAATAERVAAEDRLRQASDPTQPAAADRRLMQRALQSAKKRESDAISAEAAAKRTPLPTQSTTRDRGERVLKTVFGAGADVLNTLRGLSEFEPFEPSTPETRAYGETLKKITDKAYREADRGARPDPTQQEQFSAKLTEGATSMGLFMAGGLAGRALGAGGAAGAGTLGAFQMGGSQFKGAEDAVKGLQSQIDAKKRDGIDATEDQAKLDRLLQTKYLALFAGMGLGATEAIPIERFFNRLNQLSNGRVAHVITNSAAQSLEETAQEIGQQIGTNVVAKLLYDEGRDIFKDVKESGEVAAVLGALMGAGAGMTGRRAQSPLDIPVPDAATPALPTPQQPKQPQPAPAAGPQSQAEAAPSPTVDDAAILRAYGYSDDQIADMSDAQRKGEAEDARAAGVTVQPPEPEIIKPARPGEFDQVPWTAADGNPWGMSDEDYAQWRLQPENRDAVEKWERDNKIIDADFGADDHAVGTRKAPVTIESAADLDAVQVNTEPSEAQKEAGNYQKGHVRWNGLDISIENPKGSIRSGFTEGTEWRDGTPFGKGRAWHVTLPAAYGYIRKTTGKDGDHVDIYLGDDVKSGRTFVVDQYDPQSGRFDEHKIMAGYPDEASALAAYDAAFSDDTGPQRRRGVTEMSVDELKTWLAGDTTKPVMKQRDVRPRPAPKATDATSLLEFIASKGGVKPTDDLRAMDLDGSRRVQVPGRKGFFGVVRPSGLDMDEMRELAQEAGYFPSDAQTTTRDLLDAIDAELRGQRQQTIAEAGEPTRRDVERLEEANARRDEELASYRADLESMLNEAGMPPDLINQSDLALAVELMADEGLSADDALEQAALRNLETSGEMTAAEVDDIYNDFGVFDAVQPGPTPDDVTSAAEESGDDGRSREEGGDAEPSADVSGAVEDREGEEAQEAERAPGPGAEVSSEVADDDAPASSAQIDFKDKTFPEIERIARLNQERNGIDSVEFRDAVVTEAVLRHALAFEGAYDRIRKALIDGVDDKELFDVVKQANNWQSHGGASVTAGSSEVRSGKLVVRIYSGDIDKPFKIDVRPKEVAEIVRLYIGDKEHWPKDIAPLTKKERERTAAAEARKIAASETEQTEAGEQTALPGAEKIGDGELAQRKADERLKPKKAQKPADEGLFGDETKQTDLLDLAKAPAKATADDVDYDLDGATAEIQAGDTDDTVAVTLTREGPWDFNDSWPAPNPKALLALDREGRNPFADGFDVENVVAMLDEGLNGIMSAVAEVRAIDRRTEGLRKGTIKPKGRQSVEQTIKAMRNDRQTFAQEARDTAASYEDVFGNEAARAMMVEARKRLRAEEHASPEPKQRPTEARESGPSDSEGSLAEAFASRLAAGEKFPTIIAARKFAKETFNVTDAKQIEEQLEFGVVQAARQIVAKRGLKERSKTFGDLVDLYARQPRLGTRTSTSVRDQAYSTPIPIAYVASRLAGVSEMEVQVIYEPTAGNGALLIEADTVPDIGSKTVIANEINPDRARNLEATTSRMKGIRGDLRFNVTRKDASQPTQAKAILQAYEGADVVIANPPFGPVKEGQQSKVFDLSDIQKGYKTTEIDHVIALRSLEAMRDDGRAVLLVGGIAKKAASEKARSDAYNAKGKREFYKALYDRYNVVDHFTTAGELWERQGAAWPVDIIVISGRGKSSRQLPAVDVPKVFATWDQLGELLNDRDAGTARRTAGGDAVRASAGSARSDDDGLRDHSGERRDRDRQSEPEDAARLQPVAVSEQPKRGRARRQDKGPQSEQRREPAGSDTGAAAEQRAPRLDPFDAAFDAGLDETFGPKRDEFGEALEAYKRSQTPAARRHERLARAAEQEAEVRRAGNVAKSAASNLADSADAAMAGLVQLFGGGKTVSSGLSFDNDTYAKAKPLFVQAAQKFADAIGDVTELVKRMVGEMHRLHGLTRDALEAMRPYLRRFVEEVQSGALSLKPPKPKAERLTAKQEAETENQVTYVAKSDAPGLGTLVPVNMRNSIADALDELESRVGNLDKFVATELGYTAAELEEYLGAEQVDAVALAIDNLKRGKGFIIGDQTGIGKGRVNAVIIRWAIKNNRVPIFVTEKPNLYGDMYRDLSQTDIQSFLGREPRIIATNALPQSLPLDDAGTVTLPATDAKKQNTLLTSLSEPAALKRSYDVVFTTYNQMQSIGEKETARRSFLRGLAHDAILILDESHNAGGQSSERKKVSAAVGRAALVRQLIDQAQGTFYSSATYAKRPDVMDLYAATDMVMAVEKPTDLGEAISKGGVPMQQVVAAMLAKAGQYIRRERSFAGVTYDTPVVDANREQYDGFSRALAGIQYFSDFIPDVVERLDKQLKAEAQATLGDNAVGSAGAHSVQFTSIMHNIISQMLLAAKVKPAAALAIEALERGEKPVLTVAATMETFLTQYADEMDIKHGDAVDATFADVLLKYLDRTRTLLIRRPHLTGNDAVERRYLTNGELTAEARAAYAQAKKMIEALDLSDLPISPIDAIKSELQKKGYKVGEITGRNTVLDYSDKAPTFRPRPSSETSIRGRRDNIRKFNSGEMDAIILNQAGATGLSLHASREFKDQSRRHMIIVQPEANIDTHMQMLGRVHRTGQVITPTYSQLIAGIPAEKRPAAVLAKKMASLNANTTASRGGALTAKDVPDFLNEYGDMVAANYLLDHPELNPRLAFPVKFKDSGALDPEDAMRKMTGRIPLLPLQEQEELYEHLEEEYKALLAQMKAAGENALEAQTFDLKAKTLETTEVVPAKEDSTSPFAAPVTMEKASVALLGKPMTPQQVITRVYDELGAGDQIAEGDTAHLSRLLQNIEDGPRHGWGRLSIQKEEKQRKAALAEFDTYKRDVLDKIKDEDRFAKERAKLDAMKDRWSDIHQLVRVGRRLTLKTGSGNLTGVVLKVEQKGQPKNPLALSTWKVTFAVADATRQATVAFSRLFMDGKADQDDMFAIELAEIRPYIESPLHTLQRFETMQTEAREERFIATGNLLAAYDWLNMRGTIIHYTDDQGNIRQGILTSRDFDFVEHAVAKGKVLEDAQEVKDWIDAHPGELLWSKDRVVRVTRDNKGLPYTVSTDRTKRTGGVYYLDSALTAITKDFVSRSGAMVANVGAGDILQAIRRMQELGAKFTVSAEPPKPTKAANRLADTGELASIRREVRVNGIPAAAQNVIAPHSIDTAIKAHPDYRAAKSGDALAALRMVEAILTPETLGKIRALGPDVIYAPVIAVEQSGHNAIPMAMASYIEGELGGTVTDDISQVNRSYHTGAKAMERLGARATFEGPVQRGGRYVIVDDVTVMGSTIADLADHIQRNGGNIVGVVTLVNAGRTGVLTPTRATIKRIEERFGNEVRELFGLDPAGLTADEAAYLLNFRDADTLRTRSAASERERATRLASKGISEPEAGGGVDDPQASLAKVSTVRADVNRPAIERSLTQLIQAIAGPDVAVRFADTIPLKQQPEGWGSFGATAQTASGTYLPAEHLITIALRDPKWGKSSLIDTAFHEAFHAVENRLLTDTEMEVLRREGPRLREIVREAYGFTESQVAEMQGYEIRAMAFEYYAGARARDINPLGLHIAIRRAFERLIRLFREVRNLLQGLGYQSADSIFERVYEGGLADRAQGSASGDVQYNIRPRGNLNTFESFEPLPENWRDWWKQPDLRWGDRVWGMIDAALLKTNRALGDKYVDMRRMQAAVEATGRQVGENVDMALSAMLFEGRTEKRLTDYWLKTWKPVLSSMADAGISREDMHWFLYARHAPERNAHIAEINDQMPDGGSGMTNDEAQEVMDRLRDEGKIEALTNAANDIDRIVAHIRGMMVNDQLENERTVRRWEEAYQHYVPLRGFEAGDESIAAYAPGRGFDVRGPETQRALGRYSKADDVLSNLFMMGERTIIRGEQNRVGRTAMRFMQSNPQPDLYDVQRSERVLTDGRPETITEQDLDLLAGERPITIERTNRNTGMVETVTRVASPFAKNSFAVKIGGHTYYIRINHEGLLTALTNVGIQRLPMLIRAHGWLTRQFSALRTARNPDFFIPNLFRDVQDAAFTLASEQRSSLLRHFAANVGSMRTFIAAAMGEMMEGHGRVGTWARDKLAGKRLAALHDDWKRQGGQIAFMGIHDLDQAKREIEAAFNETKEGYAKSALLFAPRLGKRLLKAIEFFNGAIEAGTRLAVYDAAIKAGMTRASAARLSKEATTNFNRKGIYSPYLNSFYAFFNARVQGSLKIVRLLRNSPIARAAGAGLMFGGWATTMWNLSVAPPDDEDEKKSEYARRKYWERERYFIFYMKGQKEPYRIPMGYGLQLFWMLGENIAMVSQGQIKPHEGALNYLSTVVGAFSPFQAEGSPTDPGKWLRLIMPSIEMPLLELSTNENWRRRPIHPIEYRKGQKPHSEQYFSTTSPYAIDLARFLNRQSGGNAFKPGSVDLYPNDLQYLWEFAAGGLGQTASRTENLVSNWTKGVPTPNNQIPILRHFTGTDTEFAKNERYYEDRDKVRQGMSQVRQAVRDRRQGQNVDDATRTIEERAGELGVRAGRKPGTIGSSAEKVFQDADKRLKGLRTELAKAKAGSDRDLVVVIQSQIREAQEQARKAYKRMREAAAP